PDPVPPVVSPAPARPGPRGAARCGWDRGIRRCRRPCHACRRYRPSNHQRDPKDKALTTTITDADTRHDDSLERLARLEDIAGQLLERCREAGATQAEVSCSEDRGLNANVRMGEVESIESTRDRGIAVTVYFGKRKGSASTADLREESLAATVAQACAIARHTEDDAAAGLADAALMARDPRDFDAWHPWALDARDAVSLAR